MIELDVSLPFIYIALVFLPGILFALSAFRKRLLVERLFLGAFISYATFQALGALLLIVGVPFSQVVVYVLIGAMLLAAGAFAFKNGIAVDVEKEKKNLLLSLAIVATVYLAFVLRFTTLNPIYYELDPYFYLYSSYQLIDQGFIPPVDDTAWYPVIESTHRQIPGLSFFISSLYVLSQGTSFDTYKLSFVANYYPPLAGLLAAFLSYFLFKERFSSGALGIVAALLFATTPLLMAKMFSGVFEGQPNGLLWHIAAVASLYLLVREQDFKTALLAGLVFLNYFLSTTQALLGIGIIVSYFLALLLQKDLRNSYLIVPFVAFAVSQLLSLLYAPNFYVSKMLLVSVLGSLFFAAVIYFKEHISSYYNSLKKNKNIFYGGGAVLLLLGLFIFLQVAQSLVSVGSYTVPLLRTIAEQQPTGASIEGSLGIMGHDFVDAQGNPRYGPLTPLLSLPSQLSRAAFTLVLRLVESTGAIIPYVEKLDSLFFYIYGYMLVLVALAAYDFIKSGKDVDPLLVMVALLFFAMSFVGLVLVKYSVQLALATFLAAAYVLGHALTALSKIVVSRLKDIPPGVVTPALALLLGLAIVNANLVGPLGLPNIEYAVAEKPAFSKTAFAEAFGDMCDDSYCSNPELTVGQVCALNSSLRSLCVLVPKTTKVGDVCALQQRGNFCSLAKGDVPPYEQFSRDNCILYFVVERSGQLSADEKDAVARACGSSLPGVWMESMDWIRENVEEGARITSWWDYGHWINYWGQRKAVVRNDQASLDMIGDVAHAYIMANDSDFNAILKRYDSNYALFDREILFSGNVFGGKFFALNYLACARNNLTDVSKAQLESDCERENLWEVIYPSNEVCTISEVTGKKGVVGYSVLGGLFSPADRARAKKAYCLANDRVFADGREEVVSYYLNETIAPGVLKLNKAFLVPMGNNADAGFIALYTKEKVWVVNGTLQDGWEDRKSRFYDSVLYRAFILNELPGWEKVFDNNYVKIYKRLEE